MTKEDVIKNLTIVCENHFTGTKKEHVALQECLEYLAKYLPNDAAPVVAEVVEEEEV